MSAKSAAMWLTILGAMALLYSQLKLSTLGLSILDVGQPGYQGFLLLVGMGVSLFVIGVWRLRRR